MNTRYYLLGAALLILSCGLVASPTETGMPEPVDTATAPDTASAETPEDAPVETEPLATATNAPFSPGPRCTVLQNLNLRAGPGRAYTPPIDVLAANTQVVPVGYNPVGIPGGPWAQVENPATRQVGWVSAGPQYIDCNVDLTTLPQVAVAPPPTPVPPRAQSSNADGSCGDRDTFNEQGQLFDCAVLLADGVPAQFQVFRDDVEIGRAEGVQNVVFRVDRDGTEVYRNTESEAAYCLFGGNGPCNSWVLEDYVYKWAPGGPVIEPGDYRINIDANMEDPSVNLHWEADLTIAAP